MPQPNLFTGQRIRLAAPRAEDAEAFARWSEDPGYMRQLDTDYARPRTVQEMAQQHGSSGDGSSLLFHLRTNETDQLIGFAALFNIEWNNQTATLAIGIGDTEHRGQGYGREALELLLNYAFNELNLHRIGLDVIADNETAIKAYRNVGFVEEGVMRQAVHRDNTRIDRIWMGILREEWAQRQQGGQYD